MQTRGLVELWGPRQIIDCLASANFISTCPLLAPTTLFFFFFYTALCKDLRVLCTASLLAAHDAIKSFSLGRQRRRMLHGPCAIARERAFPLIATWQRGLISEAEMARAPTSRSARVIALFRLNQRDLLLELFCRIKRMVNGEMSCASASVTASPIALYSLAQHIVSLICV